MMPLELEGRRQDIWVLDLLELDRAQVDLLRLLKGLQPLLLPKGDEILEDRLDDLWVLNGRLVVNAWKQLCDLIRVRDDHGDQEGFEGIPVDEDLVDPGGKNIDVLDLFGGDVLTL